MEALLRTPLIPGTTRATLLKNRTSSQPNCMTSFLARTTNHRKRAKGKKHKRRTARANRRTSYLQTARRWNVHPLFEILQCVAPQTEQPSTWGEKSALLRGIVWRRELTPSLKTAKQPHTRNWTKFPAQRHQLSEAESKVRAKAALICESSEGKSEKADPIAALRKFDIEQMLIWNGRRAIAEFWQYAIKTDFTDPYFKRAATAYFQAAKGLNDPPLLAVDEQIGHEEQPLAAKSEPLPISAIPQPEGEKAAVVSIAIGDSSNSIRNLQGYGAVYLHDGTARLTDLTLQPKPPGRTPYVDMSEIDGKTQRFDVNIPNTSGVSSSLEAIAFFRGRITSKKFDLPVVHGIRIEYEPYQYTYQSITLSGDRSRRARRSSSSSTARLA